MNKMHALQSNNPLCAAGMTGPRPPPYNMYEFVSKIRTRDGSHPGHEVYWLDQVPADANVGDTLVLPKGKRGFLLHGWLYETVVPNTIPELPPRDSYVFSSPTVV